MGDRYVVAMLMLHFGTPRDQEARRQLADALPPGSEVAEPDEVGVFEVTLDAESQEDALQRVWDGVAAAGADDHVAFLEHPALPEHWRHRAKAPA